MENLKAPFPWFGGKSKVAPLVWQWFGDVVNYVEPFFGSGAVLLGRPNVNYDNLPKETINDKDGLVSNFWRAVQHDPEQVAHYADWPVNENDQHARHIWLVERKEHLQSQLEGDMDYYDPKIAGLWVWGLCGWIGSGWCSGDGAWQSVETENGRQLVKAENSGRGIHKKRVDMHNKGIQRKRVHVGNMGKGTGVHTPSMNIYEYMTALHDRLRRVRVCSGDWSRVNGPSVTFKHGTTAVFLDPPYADTAKRQSDLYRIDCEQIAHDVKTWCLENADNPLMRIALCGYEGEHDMPEDWHKVAWKASGGYGVQRKNGTNENKHKERIWFSPHCVQPTDEKQLSMFEDGYD